MSSSFTNGAVSFALLLSTALTIPSALVLVWLYERAVRSAMLRRTSTAAAHEDVAERRPAGAGPSLELVTTEPDPSGVNARALRQAVRGQWRSVLVYAVAGLCFGLATGVVC